MINMIHNIIESYQMTQNLILTKLDLQPTLKHSFNIRHNYRELKILD